jgi:antitoxin ParD1/3/4
VRRDRERIEAIAWLQAEVDKGRASGVSDKSVDEIFAEAREKAIAALKARDAAS